MTKGAVGGMRGVYVHEQFGPRALSSPAPSVQSQHPQTGFNEPYNTNQFAWSTEPREAYTERSNGYDNRAIGASIDFALTEDGVGMSIIRLNKEEVVAAPFVVKH